MDGVKYSPNLLGITVRPVSGQTAIKLLVVPRDRYQSLTLHYPLRLIYREREFIE